jgi:hypothetical protein
MDDLTRYGSTFDTPERAAAVLRALASRFGADLTSVSEVDLVAAAIAADAWMLVLDAGALGDPAVLDVAAREAFANLLLRAAGVRSDDDDAPPAHWPPSLDPRHLVAVDCYRDWAVEVLGDDAEAALRRAAADLTVPGRLGGLAALLALA